jgi:hypothetical protein
MSQEALEALKTQSELAEVYDDMELTDEEQEQLEKDTGVPAAELRSGMTSHHVYSFDQLYLRAREFARIKQGGMIEIVDDRENVRKPVYCLSASTAFPHLYARGERSPVDFNDHKLSRFLMKKQLTFAFTKDGHWVWVYAQDTIHLCWQFAKYMEQRVRASVNFFLQAHPDCANVPLENVIAAFKEGFSDNRQLLNSHLPGLSTIMTPLRNSNDRWRMERLGIEAISRDLGSPNLFMTLNMEPRSSQDVRRLIHMLEFGTEMPRDYPYEHDANKFTEMMNKYAVQISLFLFLKTKIFLRAFLRDICGIPDNEPNGDWTQRDRNSTGWWWRRVEHTSTRGVQHWHLLVKLPNVLDTSLLGRIVNNGRYVLVIFSL